MTSDESHTSLKEALLALWDCYAAALTDGEHEAVLDAWISKMDEVVPHGGLSDLLFWGERERSAEEAIEEAVHRETIWRDHGELALLGYRERCLEDALSRADALPPYALHYSESELPRVRALIASLASKTIQ